MHSSSSTATIKYYVLVISLLKDGKMCAAFIDLENAYDRVWLEELWQTRAKYGVSGRLLK